MRWRVMTLAVLLSACSQEPSFDERYDNAVKHIEQTAKEIDADIGKRGQAGETDAPKPVETPELNPEG